MRIVWHESAWEDYTDWAVPNASVRKRVNRLIDDIRRNGPAAGIGRPEALRFDWSGWWSRRIDGEHRLVYRVSESGLEIAACRYHY